MKRDFVYARHIGCGSELEWRPEPGSLDDKTMGIYCPTCKLFVDKASVTLRGSLVAYRASE